MRSDIAAITLNYRKAGLTARCVGSLAGQVGAVIVVDNSADTHESEQLLEALRAAESDLRGTSVTVVTAEENLGFAAGVDLGLRKALDSGAWNAYLIMNNDAVATATMVQDLAAALEQHGGKALVAPREQPGSTPSLLWYQSALALVLRKPAPGAFPYLSGACLLVHRSLLNDDRLFDRDFFMYGEDVELSWRLRQTGLPLVLADARFEHVGSASTRRGSPFYEYHVARAHLLLGRKLATGHMHRLWLALGRAVALPLRAGLRCVRNRNLTPGRSLLRAALKRPPPAL